MPIGNPLHTSAEKHDRPTPVPDMPTGISFHLAYPFANDAGERQGMKAELFFVLSQHLQAFGQGRLRNAKKARRQSLTPPGA